MTPERPKGTPPKRIEEPIGTALGVLVVACLVAGAAIWWVR